MSANKKPTKKAAQRPTLGLLIDSTVQGYEQAIWQGAVEQAKLSDVNLVTFNAANDRSIRGVSRELSQVVDLINPGNLQGLILTTPTILDIIPVEDIKDFSDKFQPMPMVSIGAEIEGIPSLIVDNYQGMRAIIDHLIEDHGHQRIAYGQMFGDNPEALERYRGYTESLADHGIPLDPNLVVPGDYFGLPEETVALLLDERKVQFDAFVAFNDDMANLVMQNLQTRGFEIPGDIAIAGFDDLEISRYLSPPLTTTKQPLRDLGCQAVQLVLAQLNNETVPEITSLSTNLKVRQSCGCIHPDIALAFLTDTVTVEATGIPGLISLKDKIVGEILQVTGTKNKITSPIDAIFDAYTKTLNQQSADAFINELMKTSGEMRGAPQENFKWQPAITILRRYTLATIREKETLALAENLFQQARALIASMSQRAQAFQRFKATKEANQFRAFTRQLAALTNRKDLLDTLLGELPQLGINSCYLVIDDPSKPESRSKQLLLAYNSEKQFSLPDQGAPISQGAFPASEYLPPQHQYSLITETIRLQNQDSGFILFETNSSEGSLYRNITDQINGALASTFLVEQVENRALQLQTASEVSRAASSILDPKELLRESVDLVKDRFDLYYVGIFFSDKKRQWAELRAGTGKAGKNMLAENWRLEIGGNSMIGRCIFTGEADIQLDVDKAPIHHRNPHLPQTKSELALPLISRGEILGALTIQSEFGNAFSKDDIAILQSMADQLANAVGNAQLYDALAQEQKLMTALMDNMPEAIYFKDQESHFIRISRYMIDNFNVDDPSEVIGKTDFDFFTEEHARPAYEDEQHIIKTGKPLVNIEERETYEDRPDSWVLSSKLPVFGDEGQVIGTFGISRDITDRKKAELTLERQSNQLQTTIDVSRAIAEILEPKELNQRVVDLVKERFHLYYAGIFIVDDNRKYAVLQAGTGEPGKKMVAEDWKLALDGKSMIGRCIVEGQADIQLDIDKAPTHLRNPHLPETKSEIALPIFSRGAVLGALTIQSEIANAFQGEDIAVLQTMADQLATSIANAQLFDQTQTALMDTETLLNVSRLAGTTVEFEKYTRRVLDLTLKSTGIEAGLFSIINPQTNRLEITAHQIPASFVDTLETNGLEGTLCDLVYQQQKAIIVRDLSDESPIDATGLIKLGFNSYQGVPLKTKGQIFGTVCTFSESVLKPEDSRIELLQAIGQQVAVAIENTRLFEQTQNALANTEQQSLRLAALNEISEKLNQAESLDEIYHAGTSVLSQVVPADRSSFGRLKADEQHIELMAVSGTDGLVPIGTVVPIESTLLGEAIKTKRPVIVADVTQNTNQAGGLSELDLKSFLVVPLLVSNEAFGVFNFGSTVANAFGERDRDLAMQLASSMGNAIENYNLIQQTQETLAELEATQRRYQVQAWSSYNQTRPTSGYQKTPLGVEPLGKRTTPETEEALQEKSPIVSGDGDDIKLTVPIMLRDQPIGTIGLQADEGKRRWTPDEIALAQEIGEQFALAAESLRLLDETQRRAAREHLVADIATKIRASTDPQAMLQTAAQELQEALKAKRTQVLLQGNSEPENDNDQGHAKRGEE